MIKIIRIALGWRTLGPSPALFEIYRDDEQVSPLLVLPTTLTTYWEAVLEPIACLDDHWLRILVRPKGRPYPPLTDAFAYAMTGPGEYRHIPLFLDPDAP